jgi:flagellar hook-associated protein 1 FlgK
MGLSQALATAVTGLRAAQTGLSIVSSNVANAETPGYVRKTALQVTTSGGDFAVGVNVAGIQRQLDQFVQRQMRVESSGASYADLRALFYDRLQGVYGTPGSDSALETVFNNFTATLQALSTSPDSASARSAVLSSAQVLTQELNGMTSDIQGLRSDAELGLADAVQNANDAMSRIADINKQLGPTTQNDATTASLLDQRDKAIDDLARLMDINVAAGDHNQVTVFTNSGIQLVGLAASRLAFDPGGSLTATAQWSADPTKRTVGTIVLRGPNGDDVDLVADKSIRSGKIAALLEMRDQILVQAQTQLDGIAAGLASALSDVTTAGTPVAPGAQSGFDIDLNGLLNGNSVRVTYTDNTTNTQHTVTLVRVDDLSALPLSNKATSDPNDKVIGLDFSVGLPSIMSQLNSALGSTQLQFSNPSGTTLRILDDGAANKIDVNSVSAVQTVTSLAGGIAAIPFFRDGGNPYTGAISSNGSQIVGFAGRIAVNANLLADSSKLVVYQTSPLTPAGDATRPNFIYSQITNALLTFSPQTGVGTTAAPFRGSLPEFMRQVVSQQGDAAQAADNLKQGQDVVFNSLQQRFNERAGVNIDEEMANLLNLQNAYAANARVLSTVKDMFAALLNI